MTIGLFMVLMTGLVIGEYTLRSLSNDCIQFCRLVYAVIESKKY